MKVICIKGLPPYLQKVKFYNVIKEVKFLKDHSSLIEKDDTGKERYFDTERFEKVNENQPKENEKMKIYFRNNEGKFCTAREYFAKSNGFPSFETDFSFLNSEKQYNKLVENFEKNKERIALLIFGANSVKIQGCDTRDYFGISFYSSGEVIIQNVELTRYNYSQRINIYKDAIKEIERIISVQSGYFDMANTTYIEIKE